MLGIDGIELSVFRRAAGADETILPALVTHAHQDLADPCLFVRVQKTCRHLHREDTDFRMHREQQRILQLPFRVDSGKSFRHVAVLIDCDLFHAQNICRAVHVRHLKFSFSPIWLVMTEQRKAPCSLSALPKTMKFPAWLQRARPLADAIQLSRLVRVDRQERADLATIITTLGGVNGGCASAVLSNRKPPSP